MYAIRSYYEKLNDYAQAAYARRVLKTAVIGRIGEDPDGFDSCKLNEGGLRETFGVNIFQVALPQFFDRMRAVPQETVQPVYNQLSAKVSSYNFV